jgi:hypothetical protein
MNVQYTSGHFSSIGRAEIVCKNSSPVLSFTNALQHMFWNLSLVFRYEKAGARRYLMIITNLEKWQTRVKMALL